MAALVVLPIITAGNYTGHWFNTHTGQDVTTISVACDGTMQDQIPSFSEDIAVYYTSETTELTDLKHV